MGPHRKMLEKLRVNTFRAIFKAEFMGINVTERQPAQRFKMPEDALQGVQYDRLGYNTGDMFCCIGTCWPTVAAS